MWAGLSVHNTLYIHRLNSYVSTLEFIWIIVKLSVSQLCIIHMCVVRLSGNRTVGKDGIKVKTENYGGRSKKIYMIVLFAMIIVLSVFKIIYIRREYLYRATDYSVYILIFMPFVISYALKHTGNISGAISLNWLCTIPMSMYLYQSMYLRFKQFDILIVYSLMGIMMNIMIFKKSRIKDIILAISGYIILNVFTLAGAVKELVLAVKGDNYEQYCVLNVIKNAEYFKASDSSRQFVDYLYSMPDKSSKQYFIAEKIAQYGIMNIIIVFVLIVGILAILFYINYKMDNEAALIATAIIIMQSVCFLLVNLGILRCSVYEVPLLKENTIYSICQLLLLVIALDSKGIVLHQFMKFCKIQKKIKIY